MVTGQFCDSSVFLLKHRANKVAIISEKNNMSRVLQMHQLKNQKSIIGLDVFGQIGQRKWVRQDRHNKDGNKQGYVVPGDVDAYSLGVGADSSSTCFWWSGTIDGLNEGNALHLITLSPFLGYMKQRPNILLLSCICFPVLDSQLWTTIWGWGDAVAVL